MGNPKVLIADDEPEFVASLQAVLQAKLYRVVIATNRMEAQKITRAENPDMVIVGTLMPRGDAFLLHRWLRHTPQFSQLPIMVVDAPEEKRLLKGWRRDEGFALESEDFLRKPVEPEALLSRIEKLLDRVTRRVRVLVVDDHTMVRDGIQALLALQRDIQVVGEAADGRDAVEKVLKLSPDVVVMDIIMPVMNGLEATKQICRQCEHSKVLMLTQYDDEENILASAQAGAWGFVGKKSASSQLLAGIRSVSQGKRYMYPVAA